MPDLTELWNAAVDLGVDGDVPPGTPVGTTKLSYALGPEDFGLQG
ncbi:hypothetical protein [Winogradskya humida]|nr:hypothetical protein [Actinoplanes humidus]